MHCDPIECFIEKGVYLNILLNGVRGPHKADQTTQNWTRSEMKRHCATLIHGAKTKEPRAMLHNLLHTARLSNRD